MKRLAAFFLCLALFWGLTPAIAARAEADWPSGVSISADGGIVMDARSGAVLYGKNMNEAYFPASITKILTALIVIENCDLDDMVSFSNAAVNTLEPNSTIVGARIGDTLSVRDCLYALLLQSANEVANALAEHCAGSIDAFAELMNRKAAALGCTNSHFANPSGLNDDNHYTSAYDMALIARAAFENPTFVEIDSTTYYDIPAGQLAQYPDGWRFYAHHQMLKRNNALYYDGVIGGKTGYTSLAGNTLVTCAERDGLKLIAVVLNGHQTHYVDTRTMLDFGFANFRSVSVNEKDSAYEKVESDLTISDIFPGMAVRLSLGEDSVITLPVNGDFADVTSELSYTLPDGAPDTAVASIEYRYGDHMVGQAYLETTASYGYDPTAVIASAAATEAASSGSADGAGAKNANTENGDIENSGAGSGDGASSAAEGSGAEKNGTETVGVAAETAGNEVGQPSDSNPSPDMERSPVFIIVLRVLAVTAGLAAVGAAVFGVLAFREHRADLERFQRQQRREKRLHAWGYSSSEFDKIMEKHLKERLGQEASEGKERTDSETPPEKSALNLETPPEKKRFFDRLRKKKGK